jgi:hypothetical protein
MEAIDAEDATEATAAADSALAIVTTPTKARTHAAQTLL